VFEVFVKHLANIIFEYGFIMFIDLRLLLLEPIFTLLNVSHEENAEVHGGDGADCSGRTGPRVAHIDDSRGRIFVLQMLQQNIYVVLILSLFI
jgi:hypothetical protein